MKTKYSLFLLISVIMTGCNNNATTIHSVSDTVKKTSPADTAIASPVAPAGKDILDTLNAISFVKEAQQQIDSITKHKHGIAYIIDTTENSYEITAGYNGELRFETRYIFSVDKKTRFIKVMDVISGDMMTVAAFEKLRGSNK